MKVTFLVFLVFVGLAHAQTDCPSDQDGLGSFKAKEYSEDEDIVITEPLRLDKKNVFANTITISGEKGKLVFGEGPITIHTKGIHVKDDGVLIIGSKTCPYQDDVEIVLQGERTEARKVSEVGDRYIAVTGNGVLQIVGKNKLPWTKLTETVERYSDSQFEDMKSANVKQSKDGLIFYKFDSTTLNQIEFKMLVFGRKDKNKEAKAIRGYIDETLKGIKENEVVAIAVNNRFSSSADSTVLGDFFTALEIVSGVDLNKLLLRDVESRDAFAMVFVQGDKTKVSQSWKPMIGTDRVEASASISHGEGNKERKVSAFSSIAKSWWKSRANVRIVHPDIGYPLIHVEHDISSWEKGDFVLLTSTDYAYDHGEVRQIHEKIDEHSFKIHGELNYRHFGEIQDRVDMRAEVGLLTRNIRIRGEMQRECRKEDVTDNNCNDYDFDTYGGHIIAYTRFGSVHIEGTELINLGQMQDEGHYPVHFHMCKDITGKIAVVKHNSIHDSYRRCVTVHGTYGTSPEQPGVQVIGNVGYNIFGHCYFLEDGAEMATVFKGNLGAQIKRAINDFVTDKGKPTVFWITNPRAIVVGNAAAGSQGFCIWYTFPIEPVGMSHGLVYKPKEAKHTPIWRFDNNVAHSCEKGGMNFDNILLDEHGKITGCMQYFPVLEPLKGNKSPSQKIQFTRLTAYKNQEINFWLRGGWFEVMQLSSADSKKGLQFARGSKQQMFVKKSVFLGKSKNNQEGEGYPDGRTDADLKQYLGVVFHDGPTYVETCWFKSFKPCKNGDCVASALGFATKNKFTSSVVSNVTDVRFDFKDPVDGLRVYDGQVDQTSLGEGEFDADETATFRDADGSVTKCPSDTDWSYPVQVVTPEKYLLNDKCRYREEWNLAICKSKYGKFKTRANYRWSGEKADFDSSGSMKRINVDDPSDTAVEEHPDLHTDEYMTIIGDDTYYYQQQFLLEFPKDVTFEARGVERDADLLVGICLPEGATKDDFSFVYRSPPDVLIRSRDFDIRTSESFSGVFLQEVVDDEQMRTAYLYGRFLYVKFSSKLYRNADWDKHDSDHCPGGYCPSLRLQMNKELPYSPCFTATPEELSNVEALANTDRETCTLPRSSFETDWGAGKTTDSQDGQWGEWTGWSYCCNDGANNDASYRYRYCDNPPPLNDGANTDTSYRYRYCDNPPPLNGGDECEGDDEESKVCEINCPVDGTVSEWGEWSECTCDGFAAGSSGAKFKTRECLNTAIGGKYCSTTTKNVGNCKGNCATSGDPVDGTRSEWSVWSDCFCDGIAIGSSGVKTRSRTCDGAANGGKYCWGPMEEVKSCTGFCGNN